MSSPRLFGIPCWTIPIFAGCAWLTTLATMLLIWFNEGLRRFPEMGPTQNYAYISNVGASHLGKPVFVCGSFVTVVSFGVAYGIERWLREKGLLLHHNSREASMLSKFATIFTIVGASGLILLAVYDVRRHTSIHEPLIAVFINGYILAAMCICAEKALLHAAHPHNPIILRSYRIKFAFILLQMGMSLIFGSTFVMEMWSPSVITEWTIAVLWTFYMWSFAIDFLDVPSTTVFVDDMGARMEEKRNGWGITTYTRQLWSWDLERGMKFPREVGWLKGSWRERKRKEEEAIRLK